MTLGEKLQNLRREKGISQDRLAELLDVSRQAVSKWERDEAIPETDKVIKLSEVFSVSIDYLLKDTIQPRAETQNPAEAQKPSEPRDFFSQLVHLFKTRGYILGYLLIVWGVFDLINVVFVRLTWNKMLGFAGNMAGYMDPAIQDALSAPMNLLWVTLLLAAVKIIGGILAVVFGKRYAKKKEGKE